MFDFNGQSAQARGLSSLRLFAFLALFTALTPHASFAQDDVRTRLNRLENDIDTLNRAVYKGGTAGAASGNGSQLQADMQVRLGRMESDLTRLTGKLEEQQYQIQQLKEQQDQAIARLEQQLAETRAGSPIAGPSVAGPSEANPMPGADDGNPPQPAAAASSSASSSGFAGGLAGEERPVPRGPDEASSDTGTIQPLGTLTKQGADGDLQPTAGSPETAYDSALAKLRAQDYAGAESAFKSFLAANPDHKLAPNARYWLGESYYARNQFDASARSFAETYKKYPKSQKAPDALFKLGMSLSGKGEKESACLTFGQLRKQFPASAQLIALADTESRRLACK